VSHCWHGPTHPDPLGEQLIRLADLIEREQNDATCSGSVPFPTGEFAVFFDFCSLMQKDENGVRTPEEDYAFKFALNRMEILYAHARTTVAVMARLPDGWTRHGYDDSGWPTFEFAVASLLKKSNPSSWAPLIFVEGSSLVPRPPSSPTAFAQLLTTKTFTNGADIDVVAGLYARTVIEALGHASTLDYADLGWTGEEVKDLAAALLLAENLEELQLRFNPCGDDGAIAIAAALATGALPSLRALKLANTAIGDRGCHALASAVAGGAFRKSTKARAAEINVHGHVAGEDESEGAQALQQACMIEGVELFGFDGTLEEVNSNLKFLNRQKRSASGGAVLVEESRSKRDVSPEPSLDL
jgi:hypothetical protein